MLDDEYVRVATEVEKLKIQDRQHQRECRAVSRTVMFIAAAIAVTVYFIAKGCTSQWDQDRQLQILCMEKGGSWVKLADSNRRYGCEVRK